MPGFSIDYGVGVICLQEICVIGSIYLIVVCHHNTNLIPFDQRYAKRAMPRHRPELTPTTSLFCHLTICKNLMTFTYKQSRHTHSSFTKYSLNL